MAPTGVLVSCDLGELEPYDHAAALPLKQARKLIVNHEKQPVHPEVMRRWTRQGRHVGTWLVVLPSRKVGGVVMVMVQWVEAFRRACERLGERRPAIPAGRPARSRKAAARQAGRELDRAGIRIAEET